jgi:CubicO group peptidase (beta-lactamase class C family)
MLLTHSSGISYDFIDPRLQKWRKWAKIPQGPAESIVVPLVFEPGEGWIYGYNTDWVGLVVC